MKDNGGDFGAAWEEYEGIYRESMQVDPEVWRGYKGEMQDYHRRKVEYDQYWTGDGFGKTGRQKTRKELVEEAVGRLMTHWD